MVTSDNRKLVAQIVSVTFDTTIKGQAKSYPGTEVIYKTIDGKVLTKNIHTKNFSFNATLRSDLEAVLTGDWVVITDTKDGDFWKWLTVIKTEAPTEQAVVAPATSAPSGGKAPTQTQVRSNYETPEERAAKQVMIVRQSSLSNAIALLALDPSEYVPSAADVISIAQEFEAYVLEHSSTEAGVGVDDVQVHLPE